MSKTTVVSSRQSLAVQNSRGVLQLQCYFRRPTDAEVRPGPVFPAPSSCAERPPHSRRVAENTTEQWRIRRRVREGGGTCPPSDKKHQTPDFSNLEDRFRLIFSARCNIHVYISRLCYDASVRLSVTEVHWRIIDNLGFKFRSTFTVHCGRGACREEGRAHLALC